MGFLSQYDTTSQYSTAAIMKSEVLSMTEDKSGPWGSERTQSITSDLPPSYETVIASSSRSPSYRSSGSPALSDETYVPPNSQSFGAPVIDVPDAKHVCLEKDPLRNVPLIGLVKIALLPLSIPYAAISQDRQCQRCGAGLGRQLTGLAIDAARRKVAEKQAKRAARRS